MLIINGSLQIIPIGISTDVGKVQLEEGKEHEPAIIQTFISENGPVQIIIPANRVDTVIENLREAKDKAQAETSDLFIPNSDQQVEEIKKSHDILTQKGE